MRSSRRTRSRRGTSGSRLGRMVLNTKDLIAKVLFDSPLLLVPFIALFIFTATDFVVLFEFQNAALTNIFFVDEGIWTEDEALRDRIEATKSQFKSYILLLTAVLTLGNAKKMVQFFRSNINIVVLFLIMLSGYFYSIEPIQVVSNVANIAFSLFACLLVVFSGKSDGNKIRNAISIVYLSSAVILLGSAFLWYSLGDEAIVQFTEGRRFGGLAGNPNNLGLLCMLGIWAGLATITGGRQSKLIAAFVLTSVAIFCGLLVLTNSATALVLTVVAVTLLLWGRSVQKMSVKSNITVNLIALLALMIGGITFALAFAGDSFLVAFTESLGKDASFTGRDDFWQIARAAIQERPIFGWAYDSHISVFDKAEYAIVFNHYHNGFLDTMVAGGAVLLVALFLHLICFVNIGIPLLARDKNAFVAMMPLAFLLIHNMTEYSILRINSMLWVVFMLCYALLAVRSGGPISAENSSRRLRATSHSRRRKGMRFG